MTPDFPAAHSMDTWWFAVDECGHVGLFDSGETGVVAAGACHAHQELAPGVDLLAELVKALPRTGRIFTRPRKPTHLHGLSWRATVWERPGVDLLLFTAGEAEAARLLAQEGASRMHSDLGVAVRMGPLTLGFHDEIHLDGTCLSCRILPLAWGEDARDVLREEASRFGIHHFAHDDYSSATPPYLRLSVPDRGALVSELEPTLGAKLAAVRLPGCFGDRAELQPAQHVSSEGWLPAWLDEARRRAHPLALGQYGTPWDDGDYARYIEHVRDELAARGISWDPP